MHGAQRLRGVAPCIVRRRNKIPAKQNDTTAHSFFISFARVSGNCFQPCLPDKIFREREAQSSISYNYNYNYNYIFDTRQN